jgi:uncharacterized protein YhaN
VSLRIDQFELRAFGPFTGTALELQGSPGSLHLITGPNEVGKSTAQRAIGDFLFGIPARSQDTQLHEYGDLRLAAVLVDSDGGRHELVRRKGTRSTLLGPDGTPLDEGILASMLGGMTREAFTAMFSITHESLLVGGQELLAAGGEVGESLFSASLGASALHRVREDLDAEAGRLFKPRATSSQILQARARLESAETLLRETTLRANTFIENERELKATEAEREALAGQLSAARADQNGRRRIRTLLPLLAERDRIRTDLAALLDVPRLPEDVSERRVRAVDRMTQGRTTAAEAEARASELDERISGLSDAQALLEREDTISELLGRTVGVRESRADLERQQGKLTMAGGLAGRALAQIRPDLELENAGDLLLDNRQRARIEAALEARAGLRARLEGAEREASEAQQRSGELRTQAEATPELRDTTRLEVAASAARGEGPVEDQLRDAEAAAGVAADELAVAASALAPPLELSLLRERQVPSAATVDRFAADQDALSERAAKLAERRAHLESDRRQLMADRAGLALGNEVPTLEELHFLRSRRDRDWARIRRRLEGDDAIEVTPDNFERGVALADAMADTLRDHAGLAAAAAGLDLRGERLETEFAALAGDDEALAANRSAFTGSWQQTWSAAQLQPLSPREMSQWLRDRATVIERALAEAKCARRVVALADRRDQHRRALVLALADAGSPVDATLGLNETLGLDETLGLSQLLATAQHVIDAAARQRDATLEVLRELQSAQGNASRQQATALGLRRELRGWQADWSGLIGDCGWPGDVAPDDARPILANLEELGAQLREIDGLEKRVLGIRERIIEFEAAAAGLIAELAPELAAWPVLDAVAELGRRLEAAVERRSRRRALEHERETAVDELGRAERLCEAAERELSELMALAGVGNVEALAAVEDRAGRRAGLDARLPDLEDRLIEAGQAPLAEIIALTAGVDVNVLDAESQAAEGELARLEGLVREVDERHGRLANERQRMERAGGAAEAGQAVEQRIAELRELVERYLRIYVAAWALREAIDQYRREHKDPLLRRTDELFPRLTCGSFSGLEVGFDDGDEPVLIGVRAGGERVRVEQMSTGTREQLYLALRIASLERHVELHGPMPVVLDDVVLHSDPQRKTAILQALADLGRVTQVVCFSHDPQVVALARRSLDPGLITVHELGAREIPDALHPVVGAGDVRPIRREAA